MDLLLLWLFCHFFHSSCWSEVSLLALWFCFYPKGYKAVEIPTACASFPSCCFCRIFISFGCVNLIGPLNQHHPVCIVSAHLVTLMLRESTMWTKLGWFASVHWDVNSYCILSLPYSLPGLFSSLWLEPTVLCTASSPCLDVLLSSSAFLALLCALVV